MANSSHLCSVIEVWTLDFQCSSLTIARSGIVRRGNANGENDSEMSMPLLLMKAMAQLSLNFREPPFC
jgi:hypothetical protein